MLTVLAGVGIGGLLFAVFSALTRSPEVMATPLQSGESGEPTGGGVPPRLNRAAVSGRKPMTSPKPPPLPKAQAPVAAVVAATAPAAAEPVFDMDARLRMLLEAGHKTEAVKLLELRSGKSHAEAKKYVDALEPPRRPATNELDAQLVKLLRAGKKIEAIKLHREETGAPLREAARYIESLIR